MADPGQDVLDTSFGRLILERIKKMMLDMTSIKFQSLVFVAWGMYTGRIEELYGLAYMAAVLGIKEFGDLKNKGLEIIQKTHINIDKDDCRENPTA